MGYVINRRGLYRTGFRTQSNPYAATQLGLTPFEPEILHEPGLGQHPPFTPGGGYGLHGLGDIVPNGAIIEYDGTWATNINVSPSQILAKAAAALNADGLHVLSSSESGGIMGELFTGSFDVTMHIQVSNGMGFQQPQDVASIVDHEAYAASGAMPSGSSASVISLPGSTPGVSPSGAAPDLTTWFEQNAAWIGLAVLGVFVIPKVLEKF